MKQYTLFLFFSILLAFQANGQNNSTAENDFRTSMLTAVNNLRVKGCNCSGTVMPPVKKLTWNSQLETAAIRHATDMAQNNYFSHVSQNGDEVDTRISATGYDWSFVGENIAHGYDEIEPVMKGWVDSYGHCVQLMSAEVTEIGVAKYGTYWVMDFAKPLK